MTTESDIHLKNVCKSYKRGRNHITIFDNLTLQIPGGDFLAIMGPSGSGKSTILNLVGGIDGIDSGQITIGNVHLTSMNESTMTRWRAANIGFVFQFYNLMPMLTAEQNVELPLLLTPLSGRERRKRVRTILEIVGLDERRTHLPDELSGGQQQRVGIARAIATDPKIMLCDEPTGDLDRESATEILDTLKLLNRDLHKTIVMVTHDESATRVATRTVFLDKGRFVPMEVHKCA